MTAPSWQLTDHRATLKHREGATSFDIERPDCGMLLPASLRKENRLFTIWSDRVESSLMAADSDAYVRRDDLVTTYGKRGSLPFSLQADWRAVTFASDACIWGLELVLSTQTLQPQNHVQINCESLVGGTQILCLGNDGPSDFQPLDPTLAPVALTPESYSGCLVFREENDTCSYIEMIHPLDFIASRLQRHRDTPLWSLKHSAVDRILEKGVIFRSRLRGILAPRERDLEIASCAYQNFCEAALPLAH